MLECRRSAVNPYTLLFAIMCCTFLSRGVLAQPPDPVEIANESNKNKAVKSLVNEEDAAFLVSAADGCMTNLREGKLAARKGTSPAVRAYGQLMVKDQNVLLNKIRSLALKKKVELPTNLSDKKQNGREELAKRKKGKGFDDLFVKTMTANQEREVAIFQKALKANDEEVKGFASAHLPMIETHLEKIRKIN